MSAELERWAAAYAKRLEAEPKRLVADLKLEAESLRDHLKRTAPKKKGRLAKSIYAKDASILTYVPYATIQDEGGEVRAKRVTWLTIPLRPGYRKNSKQFFAITGRDGNQYILRKLKKGQKGRPELWAIRRRSVILPGTGYRQRALDAHLEQAPGREAARIAARLGEVT